jgi:hypothetical protein
MSLVEDVEDKYPNTKVIPYPYKQVDEQETLVLLDEVLNSWGRCSNQLLDSMTVD